MNGKVTRQSDAKAHASVPQMWLWGRAFWCCYKTTTQGSYITLLSCSKESLIQFILITCVFCIIIAVSLTESWCNRRTQLGLRYKIIYFSIFLMSSSGCIHKEFFEHPPLLLVRLWFSTIFCDNLITTAICKNYQNMTSLDRHLSIGGDQFN